MNQISILSILLYGSVFVGTIAMKVGSLPYKTEALKSNHLSHQQAIDSLDAETGLVLDPNLLLVKAHCTGCHSPKMITQVRLKREEWLERIRWMQRNHKLWDLGTSETIVLNYLEKHYSPSKTAYSRREALRNIKWYKLEK